MVCYLVFFFIFFPCSSSQKGQLSRGMMSGPLPPRERNNCNAFAKILFFSISPFPMPSRWPLALLSISANTINRIRKGGLVGKLLSNL